MFLKRIEISGFKSFANPITLEFLPNCVGEALDKSSCGITGIVGPNGSGKSNVSDAVRWVMGEQSMKNLRGKKSEDVIFSGSEKKGKMSMAKVSLIFDNADKKIPVEYNEVIVTRKLYRSGESEYLINDSRVRLLDVIDILAQAGIGKESYCVVGQGMTDAILNATPLERRVMIEDAAGVKHFQIKKNRSIKKLDRTRDNLKRVNELIEEVKPHLNSLRRQAKKAEKSKGVYEELKNTQREYFSLLWQSFDEEQVKLEQEKQQVGIDMKNSERVIDGLNEQIVAESKKVENSNKAHEFEIQKKDFYKKLRILEKQTAVAEGRIEIYKERISQEKKVKIIPVDLNYVQDKLSVIRGDQNSIITELESVQEVSEINPITERMRSVSKSIDVLHGDAQKKQIEVENTEGQERVQQYENKIAKLEKEVLEQEKSCEEIKEGINDINSEIAKAMAADKEARMKFFELEKQVREKQQELDNIRNKFNEIKIELAKIDVREEDLISEVRQELGVELNDLEKTESEEENFNREEMELKINKLKKEYEHVGGIDPMVIDEYKEMQERFDTLTEESKDLTDAIEQLKEVIKEMDKKIHSAFVGAYKQINTEFTKYFRILFNGGNAKLSKVNVEKSVRKDDDSDDEDDEEQVEEKKKSVKTEIGIEIHAVPPNKKARHLSLLSGGERSLTSIAMLFAIISFNPPPFIILDEVEAALDEANSRRLAKIFAELSAKTQFIIITHNRETMRHSDVLYGVTMGNDGISQVLSVKLDQIGEEGKIE